MKTLLTLAALVMAISGVSSTASAGDFDKKIKARQAVMQIYSFNLGILGAMAKGAMPYDAKLASNSANNLLAAASMKNGAMWPQGSDMTANPGKTWAKVEAWTTYPKVAEKSKALVDGATKMAANAGNGLDAVRANIGDVGSDCKGCHEPFRQPKDK